MTRKMLSQSSSTALSTHTSFCSVACAPSPSIFTLSSLHGDVHVQLPALAADHLAIIA
eukprot:m.127200 g.127200  ORF g.127200 m.127200 type:complete len:58 (+) comp9403_c0_seq9:2423-2596(+)